ncbi:MAG: GTPase domain-containing protein [Eggerthellaceae bacterium]|nr:GTPase domain-containing protein [Eggerthellaceae bacterium]
MEYGNVLVIGNSGVGKSTLINAVLGEDAERKAPTSVGISGTTDKLEIYESESIPFRIIDTIGFEPSFLKRNSAIAAIRKWSKEATKEGGRKDREINVIWFCVEGTSSKLFPEAIKALSRATSMWESVPVIVVITKSYSVPDRESNIRMVHTAFAQQKRYSKNLRDVIPVVASTFTLNETAFAAPEGISELIDATNQAMPEGIRAAATDIATFKLRRKRAQAQSVVGASVAAAAVVGAVPIPIADAAILVPIETAEINALAQIYEIRKSNEAKQFLNSIVEAGTAGIAAKAAIGALKALPGVHVATSVLNAAVAGSIVAAIGESSVYAFEKVYLGEKSITDIDWVSQLMEDRLSNEFIDRAANVINELANSDDSKNTPAKIANVVAALFAPPASSEDEDQK